MWRQTELKVTTRGRGWYALDDDVHGVVRGSGIHVGLCHLFLRHTSAGLVITENADADVRRDLETLATRWAPDGDPAYRHDAEGDDDMSAHARTLLFGYEITVPIRAGSLALGTWQGIYLWEHRAGAQSRQVLLTLQGE